MVAKSKTKIQKTAEGKSTSQSYPGAWVWANYVASLPQSDDEKKIINDLADAGTKSPVAVNQNCTWNRHMNKKRSILGPVLGLLLLFCSASIFVLSNTVIRLQSYHLANYENICGEAPSTSGDALDFVKRTEQREICLMQPRPVSGDFFASLRILKDAIVDVR